MTNFLDKLTVGNNPGVPTKNTIGTVVLSQEATVVGNTSGGTAMVLPAAARIQDINVLVRGSASANTQGLSVRIGAGHDEDLFATIKCSGVGLFRPGGPPNAGNVVSAAAWHNVGTSTVRVFADVTAVTSGAGQTDNFEGIVTIFYVPRV